ncbi:EamA family transporter [Leeia oryzae]|uniref:EamA family transporter n=1 Tax=Leeia oryzae TaxID=356662 RepID=UPI0003678343|nr:EamA family transporter [Leeia oryzae]
MSDTRHPILDTLITAIGPCIWGTTYIVTTQLLPANHPLTAAAVRALPMGLLMLITLKSQPPRAMWGKLLLLGMLNIGIFQALLFISAYRLPGGVAATLGAIQPLVVGVLSWLVLHQQPTRRSWLAAIAGLSGVALMVLTPSARLDSIGIIAALVGAACTATGTIFTRKWCGNLDLRTITAWQLSMGGLFLLPLACVFEPPVANLTWHHLAGFAYLAIAGSGIAYTLWFRGIQKLSVTSVTMLSLLSPVVATLIGFLVLDQQMSHLQLIGALLVLGSVYAGQIPRKPLK